MKNKNFLQMAAIIFSLAVFFLSVQAFAEEEYCIKKNTNYKMSFSQAKKIAANSDCKKIGPQKSHHWCNENTGTWWIMLQANIKNCSPACVVDIVTKTAYVNYMCTGLLHTKK